MLHDEEIGIDGCLQSSIIFVLVNGNLPKEFSVSKGLRQGDPLAPFLFNIAVEGLRGIMREAISKNFIPASWWVRKRCQSISYNMRMTLSSSGKHRYKVLSLSRACYPILNWFLALKLTSTKAALALLGFMR